MKTSETLSIETIGRPRLFWPLVRGTVLTAALTAAGFFLGLQPAAMACLYMMAIVLQSLDSRYLESALLSFLAAACLDYFFIEPLYSFEIAQPTDAVTVACLLAASLVTTLSQARHRQARRGEQAEMLRSVVLDALAHETKTPLAAIATAAGGLRESVTTAPDQQLAELIEAEALRLSSLTTRLLRMAHLDREDVHPRTELIDLVEIVAQGTQAVTSSWPDRTICVHHASPAVEVTADPELIALALGQLLENACRYSPPGTPVEVEIASSRGSSAITIWNVGIPDAPLRRDGLFERGQSDATTPRNPGATGLGLYVARKILRAHGGDLVLLDREPRRVGFELTLPAQGERLAA